MKSLLLVSMLLTACGMDHKVEGGTQNEAAVAVTAKADVQIVLKVDLEVCEEFRGKDKLECISSITGAVEALGDLTQVLVCPPESQECRVLNDILAGVSDAE